VIKGKFKTFFRFLKNPLHTVNFESVSSEKVPRQACFFMGFMEKLAWFHPGEEQK